MPAYNEAENIKATVQQWYPVIEELERRGEQARLVIANDGSKDNTSEILSQLKAQYGLLIPIDKPNSGHGATVLYLYRYAIQEGADYIFQTDSDGQTNPDEFWQMYEKRDQFDFQIGHRMGRQDGASLIFWVIE